MKKKMLLGVSALLTLSSLSLGANHSTVSEDVTVNITIVKPITLALTNGGEIAFGSVPQQTNLELNALNTVTMNVSGADTGADIAFYINDKDESHGDVTNGEDIILANGSDNLTATLKLSSDVVEATNGTASTTISATIAAGGITGATALGDYSNTIKVYAEYN